MEVELSNGQVAEFPDDMPLAQIKQVLSRHHSSQQDKASDDIKKQFPGMPDWLRKGMMALATKESSSKQDNERGTAAGAFLRSAVRSPLEGANNLAQLVGLPVNKEASWPSSIAQSESDKSHPFAEFGGSLAGFLPLGGGAAAALRSIPAWGKLAANAGQSFLRKAPIYAAEGTALGGAFSPEGHRGEGSLLGSLLGIGGAAIPTIGRGIASTKNRISSLRNIDKLREQQEPINQQHASNLSEEEQLKALSRAKGLGADPLQMEANLPSVEDNARELERYLSQNPKMDVSEPPKTTNGSEELAEAQRLSNENAQNIAYQEQKMASMLGEGSAHRKRVANILNPLIEKKQEEIGAGYDSYIEELKDKKVMLSNPRDAKAITADIQDLVKKEDVSWLVNLVDDIKADAESNEMPADKFVSAYRSLRALAQKTRSSAYGKSPQEFDRLIEAADSMDKDVARMGEVIDNGLGAENRKKLSALNKRYATEITPLFKNKFFLHMRANSKAPKNMMEALTNEPYVRSKNTNKITGTKILNDIIRNDPELLKNVVGERFAKNPENIHKWDETANEFIQHMPELKSEINAYKKLHELKEEHAQNLTEAQARNAQLKKESARAQKTFKTEQKQQTVRNKKQAELDGVKEKIGDLRRHITSFKENAAKKEVSLKEKIAIQHKIQKAEDDIKKLKKYATTIAIGLIGYGAGSSTMKKLL